MKKVLVFIITTAILFIACNENESVIEQNKNSEFLNIDYGKIHNESLNSYYKEYGFGKIENIQELTEKLYDITKSNNSKLFINDDKEQTVYFIVNQIFGTSNISEYNYTINTKALFLEISRTGLMSSRLANLFIEILEKNESKEIIFDQLREFSLKNKLTKKDQKYIDMFKSVYNASNKFWKEKEELGLISFQKDSRDPCDPKLQVRIADVAVGAAALALGGPLAALIASNAASALVEKMQADNGGNCI